VKSHLFHGRLREKDVCIVILFLKMAQTRDILNNACAKVTYTPNIIGREKGSTYLRRLLKEVPWQPEVARGRKVGRKVCAFGDTGLSYRYAKGVKKGLPWTPLIEELKALVEDATNEKFNFVLLNLYETGKDGIGYHPDDTRDSGPNTTVASFTLGAERDFLLKPYSAEAAQKGYKETKKVRLAHCSLLCMKGNTQQHYVHCLPPRPKEMEARVNLTFRQLLKSK
jgi:alkylated DNA repair dioxygenase AlkB